jgi:transcriptional regulator with XRE-family HTH domain
VQRARRGVDQLQALGGRVRAIRLRHGWSQEDLGEAAGLHRTYVGHLERGEVNLSFVNLLKVAAALGVDARELVKGLAQELGDPRDV